jgi:hypothetical protein
MEVTGKWAHSARYKMSHIPIPVCFSVLIFYNNLKYNPSPTARMGGIPRKNGVVHPCVDLLQVV